jgi:HKD family nuclease
MLYSCPWAEDNLNAILGSHKTAQSKATVGTEYSHNTRQREKGNYSFKLYSVFFHSIKNVMFTKPHYQSLYHTSFHFLVY